jgi:hypothetical protein
VDNIDSRRDPSGLFSSVLARNNIFPNPFFSFSCGTEGPACAGELMIAKVSRYRISVALDDSRPRMRISGQALVVSLAVNSSVDYQLQNRFSSQMNN